MRLKIGLEGLDPQLINYAKSLEIFLSSADANDENSFHMVNYM